MNNLAEKIARYEEYCRADRELIAKHPDSQKYKARLKNHEAKLARMKSPAPNRAWLEATEYITREQYDRLESVLEAYEGQHFELCITYEDECPELTTRASFSVADYDNNHDFDWLKARLRDAGVDPQNLRMLEVCGDALIGRKECRLCVLEIAMENN